MRINGLHIDGFGKFADFRQGPFDRAVTIFQGANEAGKSTLLAFIRRVLYGFPDGRSRLNPYPPLAGGRHGGSLTLATDAGEPVIVHRVSGSSGGSVAMTSATGEPRASAELPRLLGHHSRNVFENVFAFTLDELHDDALLRDESINGQVYSAGMGAAGLPGALRELAEEKSKRFLKGGKKHALHLAAGKLAKVDTGLRDVADNAAAYRELTTRLRGAEAELERLNAEGREARARLNRQRRLESAWDDWNDYMEADRELDVLPEIDEFPADGINRLDTLEERIGNAKQERRAAETEVADLQTIADAPLKHERIVDHAAAIRTLEQGRTSFHKAVHDLPARRAELEAHQGNIAATLRNLGKDWDEARLESFDASIAVRDEISRFQERLGMTRGELDRCRIVLEQQESSLEELMAEEQIAAQRLKSTAKPDLDGKQRAEHRKLIRKLSMTLVQLNALRERESDLQAQLAGLTGVSAVPAGRRNTVRGAGVVAFAGGVASAIAGVVLGGPLLPVGVVAGVALIGIAVYLLLQSQSPGAPIGNASLAGSIRKSLQRVGDEAGSLKSVLKRDAGTLGLASVNQEALIAAESALDTADAQARAVGRLLEERDRASDAVRRRKERKQQSAKVAHNAREEFESVQQAWFEWLRDRGLPKSYSPETVIKLCTSVEVGLEQLGSARTWQRRIDSIQDDIDRYTAVVEPLASECGIAVDTNDARTIEVAAEALVTLHDDVARKIKDRAAAGVDLKKADDRLRKRDDALRAAQAKLAELLRSGGADDIEDFRKRAEIHHRRANLKEKRQRALGTLQRVSGAGEHLNSLLAMLGQTDIQAIGEEAERIEQEYNRIAGQIEELSTERGRVQVDLERLAGEEESSGLRAQRHRLVEEMRVQAREWVVRTVAESLLREARGKFERERQPDVLQHAREYFRAMTCGRYESVFSPLGSSEIHVTDSEGRSKQPHQLSRGTREQLFLALRFGLIRELAQRSERLPVIVDEALVNFDPDRGMRAARAFVDLSGENQVLVFTCHPQIVDWFVNAAAARGVQAPETISIA